MEIKRKKYKEILAHLEKPEITLIVGPRQAGKTTIAKRLQEDLIAEAKKTLFLNLDIESDFSLVSSQEKFLFAVKNQIGEEKAYIFIDEFQRKVDGGKFLKGLYDMDLPYKLIITGSGSIELKEQIHESLAGRKKTFEVSTLTFEEYLDFQTEYEFEDKLKEFAKIYPDRVYLYFLNYLTFGGYPRLALVDSIEEKRSLLQEIYNSYLIKDISALLKIEKTSEFQRLLENLSLLNGKLINITQLSSNIGVSTQTLQKYLWYLEKTFIITLCRPFSGSPLKEINKSYTAYFNDLGLKNLISANYIQPDKRLNLGFDFQNFVFLDLHNKLQKMQPYSINFWRSKDDAEVDFVLKKGEKVVPIECKFSDLKDSKFTRSLASFVDRYSPEYAYVLNKSLEESEELDKTTVKFLPYYKVDEVVSSLLS